MHVHEGALNNAINYAQKGYAMQMSGPILLGISRGVGRALKKISLVWGMYGYFLERHNVYVVNPCLSHKEYFN